MRSLRRSVPVVLIPLLCFVAGCVAPAHLTQSPDGDPDAGEAVLGHLRAEIQGGVFTDDDVDDFLESTWGLAVSGGVFIHDHISVGGMFDFNLAQDDDDLDLGGPLLADVDTELSVVTLSPMIWFHSTPAARVKEGTASIALGVGPSLVFAHQEVEIDALIGDIEDDDDDVGFGFQAELAGEIPLSDMITLAAGVRYTAKNMNDFEDLGTVMGFVGVGVRF